MMGLDGLLHLEVHGTEHEEQQLCAPYVGTQGVEGRERIQSSKGQAQPVRPSVDPRLQK